MGWESSLESCRLVNEEVRDRLGGLHSADCLLRSVDFTAVEVLQREGRWDDAGSLLAAEARALEAAGAELLVLCTNTMHKCADAIVAAIARMTKPDQPIRYIVDTSADLDVVGGNAKVSKAGRNITSFAVRSAPNLANAFADIDLARVISHETVLTRMSAPAAGSKTSAFPTEIWPAETWNDKRRALYFNNEGVEIIHQPNAHTDSDSIVFFRKSDVIVAGNIIDTDHFPMIDLARGGSVKGEIDALNRVIELAIPPGPFVGLPNGSNATDPQQGGTDIIAGHGRIFRQIDAVNYRDMIVVIRDIVQDMIGRKMTLEQVKAADPAKAYKTEYGTTAGPQSTDVFVETVYKSLTGAKAAAN